MVDFRRQSRDHAHITIEKTPVERVNSFKFLGVHITEDLTWSTHTDAVLKKAHQHLFFLRRLRKFGMSPSILRSFYTCTVESILTGCITAWFGNSTAGNRKALQRVVQQRTPTLQYAMHCTLTWTLTQFNWTTHTHCTNTTTYLLPLDTIQCTYVTLCFRPLYNLLHLFFAYYCVYMCT